MTLPPPNPALRASVVVPAHNEETLIRACLHALAAQRGVSHDEYEVLLVLNRCTDRTGKRARAFAEAHPHFKLHLLDGPGEGSGPARRIGMETACARLLNLGRPDGLVVSTDADTTVAPDWLAGQLEAVSAGARAIGGRIYLADDGSLPDAILRWHAARGRRRHEKLLSEPHHKGRTEHWQFSGASLALTADVYREIGGLEPLTHLEDEDLKRKLLENDVPIERLLSVRVTTSPRLEGRATRGLSYDLARKALALRNSAVGEEQRAGA